MDFRENSVELWVPVANLIVDAQLVLNPQNYLNLKYNEVSFSERQERRVYYQSNIRHH